MTKIVINKNAIEQEISEIREFTNYRYSTSYGENTSPPGQKRVRHMYVLRRQIDILLDAYPSKLLL